MLDEEEFKQDPSKKLIRDMQTPLEDCSIDPRGSMDLTISFQIQAPIKEGALKDKVMKAMLGKLMNASSQTAKQEVK